MQDVKAMRRRVVSFACACETAPWWGYWNKKKKPAHRFLFAGEYAEARVPFFCFGVIALAPAPWSLAVAPITWPDAGRSTPNLAHVRQAL